MGKWIPAQKATRRSWLEQSQTRLSGGCRRCFRRSTEKKYIATLVGANGKVDGICFRKYFTSYKNPAILKTLLFYSKKKTQMDIAKKRKGTIKTGEKQRRYILCSVASKKHDNGVVRELVCPQSCLWRFCVKLLSLGLRRRHDHHSCFTAPGLSMSPPGLAAPVNSSLSMR